MPRRQEKLPSLTARANWGKYAAGIATEAAFILGLAAVALILAVVALAVFR